jgi:hypothetical protein
MDDRLPRYSDLEVGAVVTVGANERGERFAISGRPAKRFPGRVER